MSERTIGLLLIAVVALGAVTGVAAAEGGLGVTVEETDGEPTVTVTEDDTAVENATVVVSVADEANASYAGTGEYTTDENGTVELPAPKEDVTVEVTAASGNETASTTADLDAPDGLEVDVSKTDEEPVVTVTDDDDPVENATVNVTTTEDGNATYVGEGNYSTGENGTVELSAAEEDVTVNVTATFENETASTTADLDAPDGFEVDVSETDDEPLVTVTENDTAVENASVNVTTVDGGNATNATDGTDSTNATYVGDGDYTTDENGTVELPAPEENVTVEVTATFENETASTTVDLTVGDDEVDERPFGQVLRDFIETIKDRDGGIGGAVSDFATENNPGNAPDHAGGPGGPDEDSGNDAENGSDTPGNAPDHAGREDDDERGPPDHTGDGDDDADDSDEDDADEDDADEDADDDDSDEDETEEDDSAGDDADEDEAEDDGDEDEDDDVEDDSDDDAGNANGPGNGNGNGSP